MYAVNAADIIKIPSYIPPKVSCTETDEEDDGDVNLPQNADVEMDDSEVFHDEIVVNNEEKSPVVATEPRMSTRNRRPPSYLKDFVVEQ